MPVVGEFHAYYWSTQSTVVPPPLAAGAGGYPVWQRSVIAPSLPLGPLGSWWDAFWLRIVWAKRWYRRLRALDAERTAVLERTLTALESPSYVTAQQAVRKTATTLGFTHPGAWKDLSLIVKSDAGRTENMYRHQKAMQILRETAASTHTNPEQNLLIELAYVGFSAMGK